MDKTINNFIRFSPVNKALGSFGSGFFSNYRIILEALIYHDNLLQNNLSYVDWSETAWVEGYNPFNGDILIKKENPFDFWFEQKIPNKNGYIICHDMNPCSEIIQKYPQEKPREWTGDCWKAWVKLRMERSDLNMYVIDTDYGCGIISNGKQKTINVTRELKWKFFEENKVELLNLISVDKFREMI